MTSRLDGEAGEGGQVVLDDQEAGAARRERSDAGGDLLDQHRVDPGERLVEQDVAGLGHQRAAEFQQFLLARPKACRRVRRRPLRDPGMRAAFRPALPARPRGARPPWGGAAGSTRARRAARVRRPSGSARTERCRNGPRHLERACQPAPCAGMGGQAVDGGSRRSRRAGILALIAGDEREQRALAGAVRPDQPGDPLRPRSRS